MPIYEYRCSGCGHQQEYIQKVNDPAPTHCPACGKETFTKMLSAAGFQLKGSGWYATDFKSPAKPAKTADAKSGESKSAESKAGESKSDSKSESKSETKSEAKPASKPASPSGTSGS